MGSLAKSKGITTVTGANLKAWVIHRCAVNPVMDTITRKGISSFAGILILKSHNAHKKLDMVCITTNQNKIEVSECFLVNSFVAIAVAAKKIGQKKAASKAQLKPLISGLATSNIPINPIHAAKNLSFVRNSPRKMGAKTITNKGVENSKANNCENGISATA